MLNPYLISNDKNRGFDIVIANPPYIDSEAMVNKGESELRDYISQKFSFAKGNWDIYIAFFEIAFNLIKENGVFTYISPDKWISKPFGYELRKGIHSSIYSIAESGRDVFKTANVDSIITIAGKNPFNILKILKFIENKPKFITNIDKSILVEPYAFDWLFSNHIELLLELESNHKTLKEISVCENACATSDAYKLKPLIHDITPDDFQVNKYLKIINTGTIDKYIPKWGKSPMKYLSNKFMYPVVNRKLFLSSFKNSYGSKSITPKLIIKGLTLLDACIDELGSIIPGKSTLVIANDNLYKLKLLVAVLNSNIPIFYIKQKYPASSYNKGINFSKSMINNLPIPKNMEEHSDAIVSIVDYVIFLDEQEFEDPNMKLWPAYFQHIIDGIVYELYFPELLKKHKRQIISHLGELPEFSDNMTDNHKMAICKQVFARLNYKGHPVRNNLFYLDSIPEIAIIEGKHENN